MLLDKEVNTTDNDNILKLDIIGAKRGSLLTRPFDVLSVRLLHGDALYRSGW